MVLQRQSTALNEKEKPSMKKSIVLKNEGFSQLTKNETMMIEGGNLPLVLSTTIAIKAAIEVVKITQAVKDLTSGKYDVFRN